MIECKGEQGEKHTDRARMWFKCRRCGRTVCAWCEGTHSGDKKADALCDPCWVEYQQTLPQGAPV